MQESWSAWLPARESPPFCFPAVVSSSPKRNAPRKKKCQRADRRDRQLFPAARAFGSLITALDLLRDVQPEQLPRKPPRGRVLCVPCVDRSRARTRDPRRPDPRTRARSIETLTFPRVSPVPIVTRQRACDAETPGVAVPRRKPDRGTTCPCSAITPMTLRGSRSRRCVRAYRRPNATLARIEKKLCFPRPPVPERVVLRSFLRAKRSRA